MPLYTFICNDCKYEFHMSGKFSTISVTKVTCPVCKTRNVRKKLFPTPVIYKGDGFYKNDNRKKEDVK